MRTAKSYWLLALVAGVMLAAPVAASATPISGTGMTLADLLQGASIFIGDKEVYGFHNYSSVASGTATAVDPSTIFVQPYMYGSELGIKFQSANFFAGSGSSQDTYFDFFVRILPGYNMLIEDNTLMMTGSYAGTGRASIAEVVRTADEMHSLADKLVIVNQEVNQSIDHKIFKVNGVPTPVPAIHVSKDIGLAGGPDGAAFVSDFGQTFSQITPEPATLSFLVLGGIGALLGRKRR